MNPNSLMLFCVLPHGLAAYALPAFAQENRIDRRSRLRRTGFLRSQSGSAGALFGGGEMARFALLLPVRPCGWAKGIGHCVLSGYLLHLRGSRPAASSISAESGTSTVAESFFRIGFSGFWLGPKHHRRNWDVGGKVEALLFAGRPQIFRSLGGRTILVHKRAGSVQSVAGYHVPCDLKTKPWTREL